MLLQVKVNQSVSDPSDNKLSHLWILMTTAGKPIPVPQPLHDLLQSEPSWQAKSFTSPNSDRLTLLLYTQSGNKITNFYRVELSKDCRVVDFDEINAGGEGYQRVVTNYRGDIVLVEVMENAKEDTE